MSSCSNASRAPHASRITTRSMCSDRAQRVHEFYDEPAEPAVPAVAPVAATRPVEAPRVPILTIYLIRNTEKSSDDKIIVRTRPDSKLSVEYYDAVMKKTYNLVMNRCSLSAYVTDLCTLIVNDGEPFAEIQFNFNGYPTFISTHKKFVENTELVHTFNRICHTVINSEMNTHLPTMDPLSMSELNNNIIHSPRLEHDIYSPRVDNHRWENHY